MGVDDRERARMIKIFTEAMEDEDAFMKQKQHYFECLNKGIKSYEYVEPDSEAEGTIFLFIFYFILYFYTDDDPKKKMDMTKKAKLLKTFSSGSCVPIVALSDDFLSVIASFFTIKDLAMLSLVSRQWLYLWIHTPLLLFLLRCSRSINIQTTLVQWVNHALERHKGLKEEFKAFFYLASACHVYNYLCFLPVAITTPHVSVSSRNVFMNIPTHIIQDILVRLTPFEVGRCRCVCKDWLELLSEDEFLNLHLSHSQTGFIVHSFALPRGYPFGLFGQVEVKDETNHHLVRYIAGMDRVIPGHHMRNFLYVIGSVNGLVCVDDRFKSIRVWNPITGESITIQGTRYIDYENVLNYGFGISSSGKYKVVRILQDIHVIGGYKQIGDSACHVYTLGRSGGFWKKIDHSPSYNACSQLGGLLLNGIPYVDYDYNDDELRLCCKGDVMKPFGVVSCPEGDPHYHESDRAIETIQNCFPMMENRPEDHFATIQAAIKAYQAMCQRELQAEDIWVSLMHVKYGCHEDLTMDIIREQLAIVNGYSKEAPQKPLFFSCFSGMTPQKPAQKIGTTDNSNGGVQDGDPSGIPRPYGKGKHGRVRGRGESKRDGVGRVYQSDSGSQSWGSKDVEAGFRDGGWGRFRGRGGGAFDVGRKVWGADGGSSGWGEAGRGCTRGSVRGMGVGWVGKYGGDGSNEWGVGGGSGRRGGGSSSSSSRWGGSGRGDRSSDWGKKGGGDKVECGEPSGGGSLKKGNNKNGNGWYDGSRGKRQSWGN